jgi:Mrp family chromosome partitioning ATPase/capsular polysaccharide biosynthesis protein
MDMRPRSTRSPHFALVDNQPVPVCGTPPSNGAHQYDLRRALLHIKRRLGIIIASIAVGTLLSLVVTTIHKPNYTATALLAANGSSNDGTGRPDDASVDTQIAMLQSSVFVGHAFGVLSSDEHLKSLVPDAVDLERRLKVNQVMRSRLIAVNFTAKSPMDAADIANTIARLYVEDPLLQGAQSLDDASGTLSQQIAVLEAELRRVESAVAKPSVSTGATAIVEASDLRNQIAALKLSQTLARRRQESSQQSLALSPPIQLIALAKPPERPTSLSSKFIVIPAVLCSAIFGVALALLMGALDKRIYLPSDLKDNFAFPYAGGVPARRRGVFSKSDAPSSGVGYLRAIDAVVAETLLLQKVQRRVILVTSSEDDDHSFEFASSIASAVVRMQQRVLLVDLNTTSPRHRPFGRRKSGPNVFDVLAGRCLASAAIQTVPTADLDYLPNESDSGVDLLTLIAFGQLKQLLVQLRPGYDWIILRGPPVIGVSATRLIAAAVDATILVVRAKASRSPTVRDALDLLASSVTLDAFADVSPQIFTVLTDAPRTSVPAAFRDRKAGKRLDVQFNPSISATRSPSDAGPERSADASNADNGPTRLVPSHGLSR